MLESHPASESNSIDLSHVVPTKFAEDWLESLVPSGVIKHGWEIPELSGAF